MYSLLKEVLTQDEIFENELMSKHTSFKIGGYADVLVTPTYGEISPLIQLIKANNIPYFVMGNGSNLLVPDEGLRGVVIKLSKLKEISVEKEKIIAQSGVLLSKIAKIAQDYSLTGVEFASGIPGTLGGAIVMNAGAYGGEMKDIVRITTVLKNGEISRIIGDEHKFGYRKSCFEQNDIILCSELQLKNGDIADISAKMAELSLARKTKQPTSMASAGSTFKRPEGYFAAKLIEDAGLKGYCVGGAMVSDKHAGFVVNTGNATYNDVITLINHVQQTVKEKFKVTLETEIKIAGVYK